ncbi:MAG: hypothetical protein FWC68_03585, partial [Oscillospiraceae bacterium]|nr:hypothetical protein [Oscillospiraceae bacterium]
MQTQDMEFSFIVHFALEQYKSKYGITDVPEIEFEICEDVEKRATEYIGSRREKESKFVAVGMCIIPNEEYNYFKILISGDIFITSENETINFENEDSYWLNDGIEPETNNEDEEYVQSILVHELVHVMDFYNFFKDFEGGKANGNYYSIWVWTEFSAEYIRYDMCERHELEELDERDLLNRIKQEHEELLHKLEYDCVDRDEKLYWIMRYLALLAICEGIYSFAHLWICRVYERHR